MNPSILTVNAGSSSLKFALFDLLDGDIRARFRGQIDGIGSVSAVLITDHCGEVLYDHAWPQKDSASMPAAVQFMLDWVVRACPEANVQAVGHRVIHGGTQFSRPVALSDEIAVKLKQFNVLAPLHQPHSLAAVATTREVFPRALHVACFDTAFHRHQPWVSDTYGLPRDLYDAGVRRYGFHGLSCEYLLQYLHTLSPLHAEGRVVIAHLGNGASMCAITNGKSVGSSTGFSPLDGLPMATRCGQIDPGVLLYLIQQRQLTPMQLCDLLYYESGLKGLSGISHDVRILEASTAPAARQALDYFVFRACRELGAMAATLGGLDAVVFSGGIGENSAAIRHRILANCEWMGIQVDPESNARREQIITTDRSRCQVFVLKTDEEYMIARHTANVMYQDRLTLDDHAA